MVPTRALQDVNKSIARVAGLVAAIAFGFASVVFEIMHPFVAGRVALLAKYKRTFRCLAKGIERMTFEMETNIRVIVMIALLISIIPSSDGVAESDFGAGFRRELGSLAAQIIVRAALDFALSSQVSIEGPVGYQYNSSDGTIELSVKAIRNYGLSDSGTLRLALFATENPYSPGRVNHGYYLGIHEFSRPLPGISSFESTRRLLCPLRDVPQGNARHHLAILLIENRNGSESVVDYEILPGSFPDSSRDIGRRDWDFFRRIAEPIAVSTTEQSEAVYRVMLNMFRQQRGDPQGLSDEGKLQLLQNYFKALRENRDIQSCPVDFQVAYAEMLTIVALNEKIVRYQVSSWGHASPQFTTQVQGMFERKTLRLAELMAKYLTRGQIDRMKRELQRS